MSRKPALSLAMVAIAVIGCAAPRTSGDSRYDEWLDRAHQHEVAAYRAFLLQHGVDDVVPLPQLLRTGRRWKTCSHEEFEIPPRESWDAMVPTLALVSRLRSEGLLNSAVVMSGYRSQAVNACEGGSSRSRHMHNSALDFDAIPAHEQAAVCRWWKRHGRQHGVGLGFYEHDRIHIDTAGHRTWGTDYTRRSSPCT